MPARSMACLMAVLALTACHSLDTLNDPALEAAGDRLAQHSVELIEMNAWTGDETLREHIDAIGRAAHLFISLHRAHLGDTMPTCRAAGLPRGEDRFEWDGRRLDVDWTRTDGSMPARYTVDVRIEDAKNEQGEPVGYRKMLDRSFDFTCPLGDGQRLLRVHIDFRDLTPDGAGCAAGGAAEVYYTWFEPDGERRAALVVTELDGCGRVTIRGE